MKSEPLPGALTDLLARTGPHRQIGYSRGPFQMRVVSNRRAGLGERYLRDSAAYVPEGPDTWTVYNVYYAQELIPEELKEKAGGGVLPRTWSRRGADVAGPVCHIRRGRHLFYIGQRLEAIFPDVVDLVLTLTALENGWVSLVAAGAALGRRGYLAAARAPETASRFVLDACRAGAGLLSTARILAKQRTALGVPVSVRAPRPGARRPGLVPPSRLEGGLQLAGETDIHALLYICHRPGARPSIRHLRPRDAFSLFSRFSSAISALELKQDLADMSGDRPTACAALFRLEVTLLQEVTRCAPAFQVELDVTTAGVARRTLDEVDSLV